MSTLSPEDEEKREELIQTILDEIPESFWKMHFWPPGNFGWVRGKLDIADRRTAVLRILEEVSKLEQPHIVVISRGGAGLGLPPGRGDES